MRRTRLAVVVLLVRVALAVALLPIVAHAAADDGVPITGVYRGSAIGGGKSSGVTVWVEDLGGKVRFTVKVHQVGITMDVDAPLPESPTGTLAVPISINKMGVKGSGTIVLTRQGSGWNMSGTGNGTAFGKEGSAKLAATRVGSGEPPGRLAQVTGLVKSLFGAGDDDDIGASDGPVEPGSSAEPASTSSGGDQAGDPGSQPAEEQPEPRPIPEDDRLVAYGLAVLLLFLEIMLA